MNFWSFELTFFDILVSRGRLSTCLVPGGVKLAKPRALHLSSGPLLAPFWSTFLIKIMLFLVFFFACVFGCLFS